MPCERSRLHDCCAELLAAARVLARSFIADHPDGSFTTLVIDDRTHALDQCGEPFEILHPEDLGLSHSEIHEFAGIYNLMEFATAMKPWLLADPS